MKQLPRRATILLILTVVLSLPSATAQNPSQFSQPAYATGTAFLFEAADLDQDARLDIVVPSDTGGVHVLMGRADGTFDVLPPLVSPTGHRGPVIADFDGDGVFDLAMGNSDYAGVYTWTGNGDGTFSNQTFYEFGEIFFVEIVAADFDEDGKLDLLAPCAANCYDGATVFLQGNGDGTFNPMLLDGVGGSYVVAADFDEDGHIDFAQDNGATIRIAEGNGDGTFVWTPLLNTGANDIDAVEAGDLNDDGHVDLVVGLEINPGPQDAAILVYLGNGDGTFLPGVNYVVGKDRVAVTLGDFDGNGTLDVVVGSLEASYFSVFPGNGNGTLGVEQRHPVSTGAFAIVEGRFDADDQLDVAILNPFAGVTTYFGNGDLTFGAPPDLEPVGDEPTTVVVGDLDGNGLEDLIVPNDGTGDISVLLGQPGGNFAPELRSPIAPGTVNVEITSAVVGLFNPDTLQDVVITRHDTDQLVSLRGAGDGTLVVAEASALGPDPIDVAAGDFNEDMRLDVVVAHEGSDDLWIQRGVGNLRFLPLSTLDLPAAPMALAVGRFDADTHDDLAVVIYLLDTLVVALGNGDGTFQTPVSYASSLLSEDLIVDDFNGDSIADIAVGSRIGVEVFLGVGDGTFATPLAFVNIRPHALLTAGDFNRDGDRDLVISEAGRLDLLLGQGDGTFEHGGSYAAMGPTSAVGDWNDDTWEDLAAVDREDDVQILYSAGPPTISIEFNPDKETFTWTEVGGATQYNVYRGFLDFFDVDDNGLPDAGYGTCFSVGDPDITDTTYLDSDPLAPGQGWHYLVSFVDAAGEGSLGRTSDGLSRTVAASCP